MPTVGSRKFAYGKKGVAAAKSYARKTGKKLKVPKKVSKRGY